MSEIVKIFVNNFFQFDWIIFFMAAGNFGVYFYVYRKINKVYEHFNTQDQMVNLSDEVRKAIISNTKSEKKKLTASNLLKFRSKTNKFYALYSNLTTMFPLMGMLGTVCSLIPMVNTIGTESTGAFFSALTSTFWGIVCALIFKLLDATISYKIEDNEKHIEYYFNPNKDKIIGVTNDEAKGTGA